MASIRLPSVIVLGIAMLTAAVSAASVAAGGPVPLGPDFNGDGYADLAVGVPGEDINGVDDAGAVAVIYGTATGLDGDFPIDDQLWHQDAGGVQGIGETGDAFGSALAAGDFDGDGFDDLAIGVPLEDISVASGDELAQAGAVHLLYGSANGLTAAGDRVLTQDVPGIGGGVEAGDRFGAVLVAADFGLGAEDDLAIAAPHENVGSVVNAGAVDVRYGSSTGITNTGAQRWHQDSSGILDAAETEDRFGSSLAAGDLGGSSRADLVVGVPNEDVSGHRNAGAVAVLYGGPDGLTDAGDQFWHQDSAGISGVAEADDRFGWSVVAAELGKGFRADLAIGAPYEDAAGASDAGSVNVLYGSASGLTAQGDQLWYQGTVDIEGDPEDDDRFGFSLAAGDLGRSAQADLAIGAPGEDQEDATPDDKRTGAVNVIYGSNVGLVADGDQFWWQDSGGIEGETETADFLGWAVATGNYGRDGHADLAIGVPWESEGDFADTGGEGAVNVIYGTGTGLSSTGDQFWWQASSTLHDSADELDHFGEVLAR